MVHAGCMLAESFVPVRTPSRRNVSGNLTTDNMKIHFRLYTDTKTDFRSSIFDLISGEKETKQTKGLAYVFSQYNDFLFAFLEYENVKQTIFQKLHKNVDYPKITSIEISAERSTTDKKRADIVIRIDSERKPLIAIIIEAKSIKANVNQQALAKQIEYYLDEGQFPELKHYALVGIVLTKYNRSIPNLINISWSDVIQMLINFCKKRNETEIIYQYLNFLTQIDKTMKYYEKEVLSIPAGSSISDVEKYNIYICPDNKNYNYKRPLFVTFRQRNGGIMRKLYKIDDIVILNPSNQNEIETLKNSTYPDNVKNRILGYLNSSNYSHGHPDDERFYILSETESIELHNNPKPMRNNAKFTYYSLKEILTKEIVVPESQQ